MEVNEKTSSIEKFFAVVSFFGSVIVSFITEVKMIYIVSILLCIVGIIMCVKSFKHGLILGIILTIITMGIIIVGREEGADILPSKDKEAYDTALEYMEQNDFEMALKTFNQISDDYLEKEERKQQYNNAKTKYKEQILAAVDDCVASQNYTEALSELNYANELLNGDIEIESKIEEITVLDIEKTVQDYVAEGKYKDAIYYLRDKQDQGIGDGKIEQLLTQVEEEYETVTINTANEHIANGDYDAAEEVLLEAQELLGSSSRISDLLDEIDAKRPKELASIEARRMGSWLDLDVNFNYQDIFGNTYEGRALSGDKSTLMDPFTFGNQYFINGNYKFLKATVTILDDCNTGSVIFYNDETKIGEYEFDIATDKPYEITVDITNVNMLGVRIEGVVLANAMLYTE